MYALFAIVLGCFIDTKKEWKGYRIAFTRLLACCYIMATHFCFCPPPRSGDHTSLFKKRMLGGGVAFLLFFWYFLVFFFFLVHNVFIYVYI
jgi:hypothetical protein